MEIWRNKIHPIKDHNMDLEHILYQTHTQNRCKHLQYSPQLLEALKSRFVHPTDDNPLIFSSEVGLFGWGESTNNGMEEKVFITWN